MSSRKGLLIVDDSEAEGEIMRYTLQSAFPGAEVRHCARPLEVKKICDRDRFDCVMLDYNMPELDGLTLAAQLRAANPYLPLILMTSVGNEMLAAEALRKGISDYIPKSRINAEAIRRIVNRSIHSCVQARIIDEQRSELENFAYALAHDFKQPIRQITTFSQMISEDIGANSGAKTQQHLAFLSDAAVRLGRLVDVMSKYTLLNQPPELTAIDLKLVLANVEVSLAAYVAEHSGEFVASDEAITVLGNETMMTQILQNLVINGFKFNRSPTPRVEVTAQRRKEHWIVEISDNGIGIEPEYLADIFKPLVRLHNAAEYPGSGLGLALARKAVLAQKGEIWCESTPGRGSVFKVRLQAPEAPSKALRRSRRNAVDSTAALALRQAASRSREARVGNA